MKKTISMIALLLITIFVITGCKIKEDVSVKITENKKVSIEAIIAYDDEALDSFLSMSNTEEVSGEKVYTDEERWAYLEQSINLEEVEKNNYSYEKYEDEEFKGYKLKLPETDIDSVTTTEEIDEISFDNIAQEAKLFTKKGNEYIFNSASENSAQISGDMDSDSLKFQLTFSLPQPAKENNATEVSEDRLTYKWDLTKTNKINLVFELPEKGNNDAKVEEVKVESGEKSGETKEKVEENKNSAEPIMEIWSSASSWATDELRKALENQMIPSTLADKDFRVNITRKDFAAVAVRLYEVVSKKTAQVSINNPFKDTEDSYVLKAYNLDITKGISETEFAPEAEITREQMATMLTRALEKAGIDTKVDVEKVKKFADDADLHDWSKNAVYFMSNNEIIKGMDESNFGAKNNSTIEQAVIVSLRSAQKLADIKPVNADDDVNKLR